jgi:hypothetical protein
MHVYNVNANWKVDQADTKTAQVGESYPEFRATLNSSFPPTIKELS